MPGQPLIGLTTYLESVAWRIYDAPAAYLPAGYFRALEQAGAAVVLLPPQPPESAARVAATLDGLVVTGGSDVDPARYGAEPDPHTQAPRPERDAWELALLQAAIDRELPFLAICRGVQVLNVLRGGTLIQHLPNAIGSERYSSGGPVFNVNRAAIDEPSLLGTLLTGSSSVDVRSHHHQALDRVGEGLHVTARSDDGVVQAVELDAVPFGLGVQWHPEQGDDPRLFDGLVVAARAVTRD